MEMDERIVENRFTNLDLVIFDMDGLMFDTERVYCDTILSATRALNIDVDIDILYNSMGVSNFDVNKFFYEGVPEGIDKHSLIMDAMVDSVDEMCANGVPKKPGLIQLLALLTEKDIKRVVATSTPIERSGRLLQSAGVIPFFEFIITGDDVEKGKPYPDIFLEACLRAGVSPENALVLEDSDAGGRAARAAGIDYIIVIDINEPAEDVAESAYAVTDSLTEVQALLLSQPSNKSSEFFIA